MPVYTVFVDDKPVKVEIAKTSEKTFTASLDGNPPEKVDLLSVASSKRLIFRLGTQTYEADLDMLDRGKPFQLKICEVPFKAELKIATRSSVSSSAGFALSPISSPRRGNAVKQVVEGAVNAPMTGKVVKVKVKPGEQVKAGQPLCVIEAMKMENEIAAERAGTVREVKVCEGDPVNEGETLLVIG